MAVQAHDTSFLSQRAVFFLAIVGLHILMFYAFEAGLATRIIKMVEPPVQVDVVQEVKKVEAPPPPPPPKMEHPPVEIPPPDVTINLPAEPTTTAITNVTTKHVEAPPPPARPAIPSTYATVLRAPNPDEYYPSTSQRLGETGNTILKLCARADGSLAGAPTVDKTSGSSRLDEAAIRLGSHVTMKPATVDGKPVEGCMQYRVKFTLKD